MSHQKQYFSAVLALVCLSLMTSASHAASPDYSRAVSLFDAKDFQAALPLFQQVVQDDPSNAKAYYYLGSCQESVGYLRGKALNYYLSNRLSPDPAVKAAADKVMEKLSLEDADWVEQHLDAFTPADSQAASTPVPNPQAADKPVPTTTAPPASGAEYSQAVSLFGEGDYENALPLFQKAAQLAPGSAQAYSYLGACEENSGKIGEAALDYYLSDRLSPDPLVKTKADHLMQKLSPYQQNSVLDQLASWKNPLAPLAAPASAHSPKPKTNFGIRLSTGMSFFNLADFQTDLNFRVAEVQAFEAANPSYGYRLQTSIASNNIPMELEPYLKIGPDFELGMALGYWPTTKASYLITVAVDPTYFVNSEYDMDSFEMLLKARIYLPRKGSGVRFFIEPSAGIQPINLHQSFADAHTTSTPSSDQISESLSAMAFNGGLQLGAAFNVSPQSVLSLSVGYQASAVSGFGGTFSDTGVPSRSGVQGTERLYTNPSTGQGFILFVPNDPNQLSNFNENTNTVIYSRPLSVDQSGFRSDIDLSFNF